MHYDPKSVQAQQLNHAVAYLLAKDIQPYNTECRTLHVVRIIKSLLYKPSSYLIILIHFNHFYRDLSCIVIN